MRTTRLVRSILSVALLAAVCAACGSGSKSTTPAAPPIAWKACPPAYGTLVQCADIEVPLDWDKPDGDKITVGIDRLPASDPSHRIGALVVNPGGPGGVGTELVAGESTHPGALFPPELRARFDLVGLDPRGIGTSRPAVRCDPDLQNKLTDIFPADEAAYRAMVAANRAYGDSCRTRTGPLLDHVDTVAVARDLDVIRQRLDAGPLNYLGLSYGTEIGFEYARLFPTGSRALALDGALVHSLPPSSMHVYEAEAFEDSLHRFADWCRGATDCALGADDAVAVVHDLATRARQAPLPAPGCAASHQCAPQVGAGDLLSQIQDGLLFKPARSASGTGWAGLATHLDQARHGDASGLSPQAATETGNAGQAVGCAEFRADYDTYAAFKTEQILGETIAPDTLGAGQSYGYLAQCQGWPGAFSNPPHTALAKPTITPLLINATHDPSTSYGWAQLLSTEIPNAVLLTRNGDGHTSFLIPGQTRDAITRYLIDGTLPAPGTVLPD
ncbi:alpha/beta fold hydrolase [Nocardia terpenica]|uniref:alpha/beta hydrolase n=1 Tax=Nocardia terpenica TaxID=455432 RepID=UPI00189590D3|nr:alpha/beta hydrolase [Nocardia terpenica]MBF6066153.1 alpha/beta fold hydrolase [Nocardia terpenica]MBF6109253.1 alpha/beta fold hydrolase [Nocardia terpenica]MBF6116441.1 alpha/beta fold hydrolase [Nocardia terpenica]MBF6123554.1 alpha/beta fold hydrolase [Nocardia terpenica]MBF6156874.1 alpha/beta fold hydrolase [Nocardia terpenica]